MAAGRVVTAGSPAGVRAPGYGEWQSRRHSSACPCPRAPQPCQVPECQWRAQEDSRREGCPQTGVSGPAFTQCVSPVSAPTFPRALSPSRGATQAAHGPHGSTLAFPGFAPRLAPWAC